MKNVFVLAAALLVAACGARGEDTAAPEAARCRAPPPRSPLTSSSVTSARCLPIDLEGRSPGTPGEASTVAYLTRELQRMGLEPGNPNGTYIQEVPLVGITSTWTASVEVNGKTIPMRFADDYALHRYGRAGHARRCSDIVCVGNGVVAPEYKVGRLQGPRACAVKSDGGMVDNGQPPPYEHMNRRAI